MQGWASSPLWALTGSPYTGKDTMNSRHEPYVSARETSETIKKANYAAIRTGDGRIALCFPPSAGSYEATAVQTAMDDDAPSVPIPPPTLVSGGVITLKASAGSGLDNLQTKLTNTHAVPHHPMAPRPTPPPMVPLLSEPQEMVNRSLHLLTHYTSPEQTEQRILFLIRKLQQLENQEQTMRRTYAQYVDQYGRAAIMKEYNEVQRCKQWVKANLDLAKSNFDGRHFKERLDTYHSLLQRVPITETNERTTWQWYARVFDLRVAEATKLNKDQCAYCHKPLISLKKQALMQCTDSNCARAVVNLMPWSHRTAVPWTKPPPPPANAPSSSSNKRSKTILARLNQFREGHALTPSKELVDRIRRHLQEKDHINSSNFIALPTPVGLAISELDNPKVEEHWLGYKERIANLVNYVPDYLLNDAQIEEIMNRLDEIQKEFQLIPGKAGRMHFYMNFFITKICILRGWDHLKETFPAQKTAMIIKDQHATWHRIWPALIKRGQHAWTVEQIQAQALQLANRTATCTAAATAAACLS